MNSIPLDKLCLFHRGKIESWNIWFPHQIDVVVHHGKGSRRWIAQNLMISLIPPNCGEDICLQQRHGDWCEDLKPFHSNKCYPKCSEFDPRQCSISTTQLLKLWILGVHCLTTTTTTWTRKLKAPNVHNRILGWRRHYSHLDRTNNQASVYMRHYLCWHIFKVGFMKAHTVT